MEGVEIHVRSMGELSDAERDAIRSLERRVKWGEQPDGRPLVWAGDPRWAVLAKVERNEGMKQSELAEQMEMQPITLTRLIDKLCDSSWIERRGDDTDRRVNRLYLRKAGRQLLGKLSGLRSELTATALEGINPADAHRLLAQLETVKENVRNAIQNTPAEPPKKEQRYG